MNDQLKDNIHHVIADRALEFLAGVFAMDVLGFSVMSNHLHAILRNRPDVVKTWSDEEIARRWWNLFPSRRNKDGSPRSEERRVGKECA